MASVGVSWGAFSVAAPMLAEEARKNLCEVGIGLGFLATVRPDGAPRVHPVCPIVSAAGLHVLVTLVFVVDVGDELSHSVICVGSLRLLKGIYV